MPTSGRNNSYLKFRNLLRRFQIASSKGFTLIELLVVVAVIGILSAVILANYTGFGARQEVRNVAEEFKSELRKYQTFAIAGQKNPLHDNPSTTCFTAPGQLDGYLIGIIDNDFTNPAARNGYLVNLNGPLCLDQIVLIQRITENERIIVEDVGSVVGGVPTTCALNVLIIQFRTLNQGTRLSCWIGLPLPSAYIRISDGTTRHEITVTESGEMNVTRLP